MKDPTEYLLRVEQMVDSSYYPVHSYLSEVLSKPDI